jgi:hypothetical protein
MLRKLAAIVMLLLLFGCGKNQKQTTQQPTTPKQRPRDVDYPESGVQLANGWDSRSDEKTSSPCIDFTEFHDTASSKSLDLKEITNKSSMMKSLDVSAEVQVKAIGGGGGSAKTKFATSSNVNEEQSNFTVHAVVANGADYVAPSKDGPVKLTDKYEKLARENLGEFFRECGDSFVAARHGGAELSGLITFLVYSIEEKSSLSASMTASGWGCLEANANVNQAISRYTENKELAMSYFEVGGSGDPIPTNQAELIKKVSDLPSLAKSDPKFFTITIQRYEDLPNWPGAKKGWSFAGYDSIASQHGKLLSLWKSVKAMQKEPDSYILGRGVDVKDLGPLEVSLSDSVKRLEKDAEHCFESSGADCTIDSRDQISDYEYRIKLPVRKASFAVDVELTNKLNTLEQKKQALAAAIENGSRIMNSHVVGVPSPQLLRQLTGNDQNAFDQTAAIVADLQSRYPQALREAILTQWIIIPVDARCNELFTASDCINSAEIQALGKRIVVN